MVFDGDPLTRRAPLTDKVHTVARANGLPTRPADGFSIDPSQLPLIAEVLASEANDARRPAAWDDDQFWLVEADRSDRIQYLAIGNALNFRFWRADGMGLSATGGTLEGVPYFGAMYMWRRLRLIVAQGAFPILEPEALQSIDEPTFRRLFTDDNGECPLDIALSDRVENLRDLGSVLLKRWDGRFSGLVDASDSSLGDFIRLSRECRAFDDEVAKLPLLNALMLQGSGLARFGDPLLPVVDYHVMKQLVRQGVVVVPQEVRQKLTDGSLLTKQEGSGLRATSFTALLELASVSGVSCDLVDNLLWFNRNVCDDAAPRCGDCLFAKGCRQDVQIKRPLEETRFY